MKKLLVLFSLLYAINEFSQVKALIINSETKEKVPFVNIWIENENIGTTSNENGEFQLEISEPKTILFSAIGYESLRLHSDLIKTTVKLTPKKL